jgi:hypothetical protein
VVFGEIKGVAVIKGITLSCLFNFQVLARASISIMLLPSHTVWPAHWSLTYEWSKVRANTDVRYMANVVAMWLAFLLHIHEFPGSNLVLKTGYSDKMLNDVVLSTSPR